MDTRARARAHTHTHTHTHTQTQVTAPTGSRTFQSKVLSDALLHIYLVGGARADFDLDFDPDLNTNSTTISTRI